MSDEGTESGSDPCGTALAAPSESPRAHPLDDAQFAALMSRVGPFAAPPAIAVAISGGADSLALCLLAARWARRQGGVLTALTVDHGLRAESAAEARELGRWLRRRGIAHRVLRWRGPKPAAGVQAASRRARYALLSGWCRRHRVLHLLLGHQRDDQAETLVLRLARGSGPDGLAAMPAIVERDGIRCLRPLLGVAHADLVATLERWRQPWIEDPSNADARYARVRVRRRLARATVAAADLAGAARSLGLARAAREAEASAFLARAATIDPRGFCTLDRGLAAAADVDLLRAALGSLLACVGGAHRPARRARLARLADAMRGDGPFTARTLAGCRVMEGAGDRLLVCREAGRLDAVEALRPGATVRWDDRFEVGLRRRGGGAGLFVAKRADGRWPGGADAAAAERTLPRAVAATLPAVYLGARLVAVPHLGLYDPLVIAPARSLRVRFAPRRPLAAAGFSVA